MSKPDQITCVLQGLVLGPLSIDNPSRSHYPVNAFYYASDTQPSLPFQWYHSLCSDLCMCFFHHTLDDRPSHPVEFQRPSFLSSLVALPSAMELHTAYSLDHQQCLQHGLLGPFGVTSYHLLSTQQALFTSQYAGQLLVHALRTYLIVTLNCRCKFPRLLHFPWNQQNIYLSIHPSVQNVAANLITQNYVISCVSPIDFWFC